MARRQQRGVVGLAIGRPSAAAPIGGDSGKAGLDEAESSRG